MKRRRYLAALTAAALALSLAACGQGAEPGGESPSPTPSQVTVPEAEPAVFALGYAGASTLHPLETTDQSNLDVAALVYEGLYELDETFEPQPLLAQSASASGDGLTWTITLRTDAAFSDGSPLTAEQVVSSLNKARQGGAYAARLAGIASVREEDGGVVITLLSPNGALPSLLDVPIVLEREEGLPLGTGPYAFHQEGDSLWLEANPGWWQGRRPLYDTISLWENQSLEDRVSAFDSGEVTAVTTDFTAANALGYSGTYETHDFTTTSLLFVGFNTAEGFCADSGLRAALSRAFDRGSIVTGLLSGHGDAAELPVHPGNSQYSQTAAGRLSYDLEGARAILEEAGYAYNEENQLALGKQVLSLSFIVNRDSLVKQAIAEHIAQDLRELGMEVTVRELDWEDYTAALAGGDFDLYMGEVKLTGDFDISALLAGTLNYGGYQNELVLALLESWKGSSGAARQVAAGALYLAMAEDLPFASLCFKRGSLLIRWGMAEGLAPLRGNPFAGIGSWKGAG